MKHHSESDNNVSYAFSLCGPVPIDTGGLGTTALNHTENRCFCLCLCPGEQMFLQPEHVLHHRQTRGLMSPSQGGSYLSSRHKVVPDAVFRVKSHVYAMEGQDCRYQQMFGTELRAAVSSLSALNRT